MKTIFVILVLLFVSGWSSSAQDEESPAPTNPYSVFEDDTCIAPCWFGLIPGESTTDDVEKMIEQNEDIFWVRRNPDNDDTFNPNTPVSDGWYRLLWQQYGMDSIQIIPTLIHMKNGIVYYIDVQPQYPMLLSEILEIYGSPDFISVHSQSYCNLYLLYTEKRVAIDVRTDLIDDQPSTGIIGNDYELVELDYYSPQVALEIDENSGILGLYLYHPEAPNIRPVPTAIWLDWLSRDDVKPCSESEWDSLPNEIETPVYPTLTPTTND